MLFALGLLVLNMLILACVLAVNHRVYPPPFQANGGARKKELWF
jgi:hypothetical protein